MKGIFHKRVPSFSFTTFNWSKDDKDAGRQESRSQPSTPFQADFDLGSRSSLLDADPPQVLPSSATRSISTAVGLHQPPQLDLPTNQLKSGYTRAARSRAGSLVESIPEDRALALLEFPSHARGRRGSANDAHLASIASSSSIGSSRNLWNLGHTNHFGHQRKRFSSLFGGHRSPPASRSSSPGASSVSVRSMSMDNLHGYDSDGRSVGDVTPANAFDQGSDSDEDSSCSNGSGKSSEEEEEDMLDYMHDETIIANTTANASAFTPIDFLQSSDQPVPFIDSAPNLTSPPPTPIPFSSTSDFRQRASTKSVQRKSSLASKAPSLRRKRSTHPQEGRVKLPLVVSRPIYEKNRCTISIEHGDNVNALKKSERTRFYIVASDLSDDSKYAIEWTIGTVLRQGDEVGFLSQSSRLSSVILNSYLDILRQCLIITIIETESKC